MRCVDGDAPRGFLPKVSVEEWFYSAFPLALFSCKSAVNAMGQKDFSACRHALMELLLLLVPHDQDPTPLCQPERCCAAGLLCLPLCPWSRTGLYCESSEITLKLGKYYDVFVCF